MYTTILILNHTQINKSFLTLIDYSANYQMQQILKYF